MLGAKGEPIRQMLEEHQEIRRLASEFVAAARALDGSLDRFAVAASGCAAACNAAPARVALLRVVFGCLPLWRRPVVTGNRHEAASFLGGPLPYRPPRHVMR